MPGAVEPIVPGQMSQVRALAGSMPLSRSPAIHTTILKRLRLLPARGF